MACLGAVAAFGGGAGPDGYVAVGTAGGKQSPGTAPSGEVRLVPLDPDGTEPPRQPPTGSPDSPDTEESASAEGGATGSRASGDGSAGRDRGSAPGPDTARGTGRGGAGSGTRTGAGTGSGSGAGSGTGAGSAQGTRTPAPPGTSAPGTPSAPATAGPAALKVGEPVLQGADKRWCQKVTLALRNSGGSAVRAGTVTFRTHIIGSLGVDWATVESTEKLPVPIGAGEEKKKTWTVCVESWRVPLGMHIETRDVSVDWE
ncbi:hypothetical protein [Streptomyces sp. NPDC016845]|uniref:hypothetical protein n=1 Tax=Streptomyces sp. NPDC016845 TaxID=3364972 RepID=UPI0037B0A167